jgi:hypothetical protein
MKRFVGFAVPHTYTGIISMDQQTVNILKNGVVGFTFAPGITT